MTRQTTTGAVPDGLPTPRRYLAAVAVSLGTILTTVDGSIVNVALPTLALEFHVTSSAAVLVVTVYQLIMMMTMLPFSALGDRFGFRATYQWGQVIFVSATVLCFFARTLPALVAVRAIQALGAAITMSVSSALIRSIYPTSKLGRGLSFNTLIGATAASFAPTLGGAILAFAPWPWLFALAVPFAVLSILIGKNALPGSSPHSQGYDLRGAILCAATLGLASTTLQSAVHGGGWPATAALLFTAAGIGYVFVRRESGIARPMFPLDILRNKQIAFSSSGLLAAYAGSMIVLLSVPIRLQQQFHFTPAEAGAVLVPWPLSILAVAPAAGMMSDRIPAGVLGGIGMCIAIAGMLCIAFLPDTPSHLGVMWRMAICGIGFGMYFSPSARQIIGSAPIERAAAAGALSTTIRQTGLTIGSTAVAALLAAGIGTGSMPALIAASLGAVAGVCSIAALKPPGRSPEFLELSEP